MAKHELKTWPEHFEQVEQGRKTFEIRKDDRGFAVDDVLWLREYTPGVGLTGRELLRRVTYLTTFAQQPDYVVLALGPYVSAEPLYHPCGHKCYPGAKPTDWCIECRYGDKPYH